ncbi:MAG TPA: signal peptidase I [Dehalococcoidia bacterium]|nr:signal peptidase I [Dehalococcoidia bacterium]
MLRQLLALSRLKPVKVRGWSMSPSLLPGEYVLVDCSAYRLAKPTRGEVVLAAGPPGGPGLVIKRIVALPGDEAPLLQTVASHSAQTNPVAQASGRVLAADEYFLLGDWPEMSTDSRNYGPVKGKDILGRAWLVYWPPKSMRLIR